MKKMNITRDVIRDLLPLYAAGEASRDTKDLVEEFLRADAELRRLADALRVGEEAPTPPGAPLEPTRERVALERTRTLLRLRSFLLGFSILFTGLPLSFAFDSSEGLTFLLIRDAPSLALTFLGLAVVLWIAFAVIARRLRVTGL